MMANWIHTIDETSLMSTCSSARSPSILAISPFGTTQTYTPATFSRMSSRNETSNSWSGHPACGSRMPCSFFFFFFFLFRFCVDASIYFVARNTHPNTDRSPPRLLPLALPSPSGTLPMTLTSLSATLTTRTFLNETLKS
jgi:hypothetical protein